MAATKFWEMLFSYSIEFVLDLGTTYIKLFNKLLQDGVDKLHKHHAMKQAGKVENLGEIKDMLDFLLRLQYKNSRENPGCAEYKTHVFY